jgi:two-component system nitrogen regulation response regulator NtrX
VLAATNKNLAEEIKKGTFREDLYWRLNVVPINTPPLRDRREDIGELVTEFVKILSAKGLADKHFTDEAIDHMKLHHWPGNVRELRNFVERALIMSPDSDVKPDLVCQMLRISRKNIEALTGEEDTAATPGASDHDAGVNKNNQHLAEHVKILNFKDAKKEFEKLYLTAVVAANNGNISKTAEKIGMERSHLHKKLRSFETD